MSVNICFIDLSMLRGTCYSILEPTKPVILAVSYARFQFHWQWHLMLVSYIHAKLCFDQVTTL